MSEQIKDPGSNNNKGSKWSFLVICYFMSLMFLFLGFGWLEDINTKGYYIDGKHHITIVGKEGFLTVYALIIGGFCMLAFSIYSTFKNFRK